MFTDPDRARAEMRSRRASQPANGSSATSVEEQAMPDQPVGKRKVGLGVAGAIVLLGAGTLIGRIDGKHHRDEPDPALESKLSGDKVRDLFSVVFDACRQKHYGTAVHEYFSFEALCQDRLTSPDVPEALSKQEVERLHWLLACSFVPIVNKYTADRDAMEMAHPELTPALIERLTSSLQECFLHHGFNQAYVLRSDAARTPQLTDRQKAEIAVTMAFSRQALNGFDAFDSVEFYLPAALPSETGLQLVPIEPSSD